MYLNQLQGIIMMNRMIRKDKRTRITEHVYAADGRKKEPHPNPLPCFEVIL